MKPHLATLVNHPHPHVVAKLRAWLELAELGQIDGVALAGECIDGSVLEGHAGRYSAKLIGGIEFLKIRIMRKLDE